MDLEPQSWATTFSSVIQNKQYNEAENFISCIAAAIANELTTSVIGNV